MALNVSAVVGPHGGAWFNTMWVLTWVPTACLPAKHRLVAALS